MRVLVFDIPAADSGALGILKSFHAHVCSAAPPGIEWIFVVSTPALSGRSLPANVRVLSYPAAKQGWLRRILFELLEATRIVRREGADVVLSLQSTAVLRCSLPQVVYVHQSLPFAARKFSLLKREERFLAVYSRIFRSLIGWSVRRARAVIVQTSWFRDALCTRFGLPVSRVSVVPPQVRFMAPGENIVASQQTFFYPTTPFVYKNIDLLVDAVEILRGEGLAPVVQVTIRGDENAYSSRVRRRVVSGGLSNLIQFIGRIPFDRVISAYRGAVLVFPSLVESFGLPLLEGRLIGATVIASDLPFCREILDGYPSVDYFDPTDAKALAAAMKRHIRTGPASTPNTTLHFAQVEYATEDRWSSVVDIVRAAGKTFGGATLP